MHQNQMVNPYALDPEPNAIVWDWATIFILGVGNLAALDFQARSMASKTPKIARRGNFIAGLLVIFIGVPFAYLGATTRYVRLLIFRLLTSRAEACECN
jgi:hypothetical protein